MAGEEDVFLVAEVVVEVPLLHPQRRGDVFDGRAVVTLLAERHGRALQDLYADIPASLNGPRLSPRLPRPGSRTHGVRRIARRHDPYVRLNARSRARDRAGDCAGRVRKRASIEPRCIRAVRALFGDEHGLVPRHRTPAEGAVGLFSRRGRSRFSRLRGLTGPLRRGMPTHTRTHSSQMSPTARQSTWPPRPRLAAERTPEGSARTGTMLLGLVLEEHGVPIFSPVGPAAPNRDSPSQHGRRFGVSERKCRRLSRWRRPVVGSICVSISANGRGTARPDPGGCGRGCGVSPIHRVGLLGGAGPSERPCLARGRGEFVVAAWAASLPSGVTDVFVAVSRDAGLTFGTPTRVNARSAMHESTANSLRASPFVRRAVAPIPASRSSGLRRVRRARRYCWVNPPILASRSHGPRLFREPMRLATAAGRRSRRIEGGSCTPCGSTIASWPRATPPSRLAARTIMPGTGR